MDSPPHRTVHAYAQRSDTITTRSDGALGSPLDRFGRSLWLWGRKAHTLATQRPFLEDVERRSDSWRARSTTAFRADLDLLRRRLRTYGLRRDLVAESFAAVRETADRTIGQRPYRVQLEAGRTLLRRFACEMQTGEGKTLTASLPACTAALAGHRVHVITVNDYLAGRDADAMGPIYRALGLDVGLVAPDQTPDERRAAYHCPVTYCTNKSLVFDYLRDRLTLGDRDSDLHLLLEELGQRESSQPEPNRRKQLLLRGLDYAIVDELDSVLIDEARTPLILSQSHESDANPYAYAWARTMAATLRPREHFVYDRTQGRVDLTVVGQSEVRRLAAEGSNLAETWRFAKEREQRVAQALTAQHVFRRDRDYLVRDGKVEIIDRNTGRSMPDRSWEHGLHQAIEVKEGCAFERTQSPIARLTYQRFFRCYHHLSGMTGTAAEVRSELESVYGLSTIHVRTHRPERREALPSRTFRSCGEKYRAIVARVAEVHETGRPVLVGTRSVQSSEELAKHLRTAGLDVRLLNARQDQDEAAIVARAGERRAITVATDMAGRGTDIRLSSDVIELGGLHVISAEPHESRRVDRQLFGRCGRQGNPGSYERFISLEDDVLVRFAGPLARRLSERWSPTSPVAGWSIGQLARHAQRVAERRHRQARRQLLLATPRSERRLAFAGHESRPRASTQNNEPQGATS